MSAMNRKKALAARLICSYRNRGRKVNTPYLVVLQQKTETEDYFKKKQEGRETNANVCKMIFLLQTEHLHLKR